MENVPFDALVLCVTGHKVSSPSGFFLATEIFFVATILQLKVAKRRLFEKVRLECCVDQVLMEISDSVES